MQSDCSGNSPCQNCANDGSDCLYVGRKRKRISQHSPQNQTDHLQIPPASGATIGRADRSQRDLEALTTNIPSTIGTEFNGMVASATEDGGGVDWAAPALYQGSFNTQATVPRNDMLSSFMPAGSTWTGSPTFDYSANANGEIMLTNEAIFDASGSWSNWLPFDQVPPLRNEPASIVAPYSASASQREQASSQPPEGPQAAQSQASHILSPTRTSDIGGSELAQLENSTRTMPPVPTVDRHHLRPRPSQSGSKRDLYVAGAGARSTRIDRARRARRKSPRSTNASLDESPLSHSEASSIFYLHESMDEHALHADFDGSNPSVTQQEYSEILSKIVALPSTSVSILHPFSSDRFPSLRTLSYLIHLYFKNFHPVYPFLNEWMIGVPGWGWSMTLATAAIGAQYMNSSISHASSNALHGLLYSALMQDVSKTCWKAYNSGRSNFDP